MADLDLLTFWINFLCRAKAELEERMVKVGRERADLALQLKENGEEMQELIKKYKVVIHSESGWKMLNLDESG